MTKKNDTIVIDWITPKKLFLELGISLPTQAKLRMKKQIPYSKIGSKIFYSNFAINKWLEDAKVESC